MTDVFVAKNKNPTDEDLKESPVFKRAFFSAFIQNPNGVSFQNQEDDEEILLFLRRHFITNLPWLFTSFLLLLIPCFFLFFNLSFLTANLMTISPRFIMVAVFFYYLIVLTYILINFMTWYYNIFIVTQKRVFDIDFADLVYQNVALTKLDLIQDIDYTQTGFIRSFFDYGDLFIQTAGDKPNFEASSIPSPAKAAQIIENLIGRGESNV